MDPWLRPDASRAECEQALQGQTPGTFIIRKGSKSPYTLSVADQHGGITHLQVDQVDNKYCIRKQESLHASLELLVAHYANVAYNDKVGRLLSVAVEESMYGNTEQANDAVYGNASDVRNDSGWLATVSFSLFVFLLQSFARHETFHRFASSACSSETRFEA